MSAITQPAPPAVRWDLSYLFSGPTDPRIEELWSTLRRRAEAFAAQHRGRINSENLDAGVLLAAIQGLEAIVQEAAKPGSFAHLVFSTDSSDPAVGPFLQKQMEKSTELSVILMFFELELQALPDEVAERVLADPRLGPYEHYIRVTRSFSPYRLSEPEEVILEETANTGSRAWVRLFDELSSGQTYRFMAPGEAEPQLLTQMEVLNLLHEPDRAVRQAAADALSAGLKDLQKVVVFVYNTLLQDKSVEDRLRKMAYPELSRHLSNELDRETVELVVSMCVENYDLVERFYNVKRSILGLSELTHVDRYAPLFETEGAVDYERGRQIVLDSFGAFSPVLRERADQFFRDQWIDAEPRLGKRGGAFCMYVTPDTHPVVFLNYLNKIDDVMTLAHELGHGVHASLSREQSYFNFHGTLPLAELASTFGEMLVFERVAGDADLKDKLALYAGKIEAVFATVFRQAAMYRFEKRSHETRRTHGELNAEQFGDIWQEELQAMFGGSVTLGDQHRDWWTYVGHFIHTPFYVYAYSFGELLVLSLYAMAKQEGPGFAERYISLLRKGGSQSPQSLMASVGIDLRSREFWSGGFRALESLVSEFERLWNEFSETPH